MAETYTQEQATEKSNAHRKKRNQLSSVQLTFAAILAIGLMLAINFSNRISADRALKEVQDEVNQEIALLKREQSELIEELNYVSSDAYVESWAHSEGKMVREGEVLIIPKAANVIIETVETPETTTTIPLETTAPEPEHWEIWWALFFDSDPPDF